MLLAARNSFCASRPFDQDGPACRFDDAADRVDQRGFARAIGAKERENLAALDIEIDILESLQPALVGLRETPDRENGLHAAEVPRRLLWLLRRPQGMWGPWLPVSRGRSRNIKPDTGA